MGSAGWTVENLLKAVALVGAAVAFVVSLLQYRKAQQWKRAEWVAREMKAFLDAPLTQAALHMIDYPDRRVLLYPDREHAEDRYQEVTDQIVRDALRRHDETRPFTDAEVAIRDAVDSFLDGLERLDSYVQARLVSDRDVQPYVGYWAARIVCPDPTDGTTDRLLALRQYMALYNFHRAAALLARVKTPPAPRWWGV